MRALAIAALLFSACTVDSSFLDERLFTCGGPTDCGDGWGCARATPYHADFCAQRCDATTCDGVCSQGLCLRGCHINPDGSTSACQSTDYQCIRTRISDANGICYPVHQCRSTADCAENEYCLTELFTDMSGNVAPGYDDFYCIPRPATDGGSCPAGSIPVPLTETDARGVCFATCSTTDRRCPPGFGCEFQYMTASGAVSAPCFLGSYGVPCEDDTNCISGHCMDSGTGRYCTLTCDEASVLSPMGCTVLAPDNDFGSFYTMKCNPAANGGMGGGLCDVRYTTGFPSCSGDSTSAPGTEGHYVCADGLVCRHIMVGMQSADLCTKSCTASAECNAPGTSRNYCANLGPGQQICLNRARRGGSCAAADGCLPGLTCSTTTFECG